MDVFLDVAICCICSHNHTLVSFHLVAALYVASFLSNAFHFALKFGLVS